MEYLKPIEVLEQALKQSRMIIVILAVILGLSIVLVPNIVQQGNPVVVQAGDQVSLARTSAWKNTLERYEQFAKVYLSHRFEWGSDNFKQKKEDLSNYVSAEALKKFSNSFVAFESLSKNQGARSYFIIEAFRFSNADHKIEIDVSQVLRVKSTAFTSPIKIALSVEDVAFTEKNPFGLRVVGVEEQEVAPDRGGS